MAESDFHQLDVRVLINLALPHEHAELTLVETVFNFQAVVHLLLLNEDLLLSRFSEVLAQGVQLDAEVRPLLHTGHEQKLDLFWRVLFVRSVLRITLKVQELLF